MNHEPRIINQKHGAAARPALRVAARFLRGYTLVEMLVVIAIGVLMMSTATAAILGFYRANSATLAEEYAVASARQGLESAVATIRGAEYGADGSYPIASIGTSTFTFYADTNGDGIPEKVRYYLSGPDFMEDITYSSGSPPVYPAAPSVTKTLSGAVQNGIQDAPIFQYYDSTSTNMYAVMITDPLVYATVHLIVNAAISTEQDYTLDSAAALRNVSQF